MRCDTCKFFTTTSGVPHCRRLPPSATSATSSAFPVMPADGWCYAYSRSIWRTLRRTFRSVGSERGGVFGR